MASLLYVCVSCARNAAPGSPGHAAGQRLAQALARALDQASCAGLEVREVACLNACPHPCNASLRGARRHTLRFSGVTAADCATLAGFATAYWTAAAGEDALAVMPAALRAKLSVCTPPPVVSLNA